MEALFTQADMHDSGGQRLSDFTPASQEVLLLGRGIYQQGYGQLSGNKLSSAANT